MENMRLYQFANVISDNTFLIINYYRDKYNNPDQKMCFRADYPMELNNKYIRKIYAVDKNVINIDVYDD